MYPPAGTSWSIRFAYFSSHPQSALQTKSEPNHNFLQTLHLVNFYHYTCWNGLSLQLLWDSVIPQSCLLPLQWTTSPCKLEQIPSSSTFIRLSLCKAAQPFYTSVNQQWPRSPLPLVSSQIGWVGFTTALHIFFIHSPWMERVSGTDICKCRIGGWCWKVEEQKCWPTAEGRKMWFNGGELWGEVCVHNRQHSLKHLRDPLLDLWEHMFGAFEPAAPTLRLSLHSSLHFSASLSPLSESLFLFLSHKRVIHPLRLLIKTIREQQKEQDKRRGEERGSSSLLPKPANLPERCADNFLHVALIGVELVVNFWEGHRSHRHATSW